VTVLCPVSGKDHLADEAIKHTGIVPVVHGGNYTESAGHINIIGIESQSASIRAMNKLSELSQDAVVICDESQLIKNRNTARAQHISEATRGARYRYIASGLAMPNGVEDLWFQMQWLSPLILGYRSYSEFARMHLRYAGDNFGMRGQGRIVARFNTDVIAAKIAPYAFECRKADCIDLPPKTYSYKTAVLDDASAEAYREAKRRILHGRQAFDVDDATIYRLFTALQLISSGVAPEWLYDKDKGERPPTLNNAKLPLLRTVLGDTSGKRVVWCKYRVEADQVEQVLVAAGIRYERIDGKVRPAERCVRLRRWKEESDILISTIQVGGMVHDWGFADYAIYLSNSFDYMLRAQSEDRTHRAMMTGKAHYIDLRADCGIERRISRSLGHKEHALKAFQDKIRQLRMQQNKDAIVRELEAL
jgi:SNF2 family DNA or RNA helicase